MQAILRDQAIVLSGEKSIGTDMPTEANTTWCIPYQPGLGSAVLESKPDVLVGDGFFQWSAVCIWHRFRHGIPFVCCYERWSHTERNAQWYRRAYRSMAFRYTDAISCNGSLSRNYVLSLGFPKENITIVHMAAATAALSDKARCVTEVEIARLRSQWLGCLGSNENSLNNLSRGVGTVFLYVGRLILIKGLKELVNGFAKFCDNELKGTNRVTTALVIIGTGREEEGLRRQVEELKIDSVYFQGYVDYDNFAPYYAAADAFIIPTLEDNWSLVVPEAMACGLPILCSKYNGCWPDLVQEGRNGCVFDPFDAVDLARCLAEAANCGTAANAMPTLSSMGQ